MSRQTKELRIGNLFSSHRIEVRIKDRTGEQ